MLGDLPTWMDFEFVKTATGVAAILAVIAAVVVLCTIRSLATRLLLVALLGASLVGLLHYRETLTNCDKHGCACKFLGEDLEGGGCSQQ